MGMSQHLQVQRAVGAPSTDGFIGLPVFLSMTVNYQLNLWQPVSVL